MSDYIVNAFSSSTDELPPITTVCPPSTAASITRLHRMLRNLFTVRITKMSDEISSK
jgi:hypothetical protein